jgi:hypothetical protein
MRDGAPASRRHGRAVPLDRPMALSAIGARYLMSVHFPFSSCTTTRARESTPLREAGVKL